jgi:hypothetical protein
MEEYSSPFKLPTDEEVFISREAERLQKAELRERTKHMPIWDKQTACTKSQLKRPKLSSLTEDDFEQAEAVAHFPLKQQKLINAALEIVGSRKKQTFKPKTDNIRDYVEQKKDLFLDEMSYRILNDEIKKIKLRCTNKEEALKNSAKLLDEDSKGFNDHMEKKRKAAEDVIAKANAEAAEKKKLDQKIKELEGERASITTEISRYNDNLEALEKHRFFLDLLTPQEWKDEQEQKRQNRYRRVKEIWVARQLAEDPEINQPEETESQLSGNTQGVSARKRPTKRQTPEQRKQRLEERFDDLANRGVIDADSEENPVYFTDAEQLMNVFKDLEDKSLFLIEQMQTLEHQVETMRHDIHYHGQRSDDRSENLKKNRDHLANTLGYVDGQVISIEQRLKNTEDKAEVTKAGNSLREAISNLYKNLVPDSDSALGPLEKLMVVEALITERLNKIALIEKLDPAHVDDESKRIKSDHRASNRTTKLEAERKRNAERVELAQKRAEAPIFKRYGKPPMFKRVLRKDKKREVKKVEVKTEDQEIQEFLESS